MSLKEYLGAIKHQTSLLELICWVCYAFFISSVSWFCFMKSWYCKSWSCVCSSLPVDKHFWVHVSWLSATRVAHMQVLSLVVSFLWTREWCANFCPCVIAGHSTESGVTTKQHFWGGHSYHSRLWQVKGIRIRSITLPLPLITPMQCADLLYCSFSRTVGRACEGVDVGETVAFQVEVTLTTCTEQLRREVRQRWALLWPSSYHIVH